MLQKIKAFFFQTASKAGSHGLLTYASSSCYGGNATLTTPCPKVIKHDNSPEQGQLLQGSCLNYNLKRYSCFMADIFLDGSKIGDYTVKESRQAWYSDPCQVLHVSVNWLPIIIQGRMQGSLLSKAGSKQLSLGNTRADQICKKMRL